MAPQDDRARLIDNTIESIVTLRNDLTQQRERTKVRLEELDDLVANLKKQREQLEEMLVKSKAAGSAENE
jgi:hypothetical protein